MSRTTRKFLTQTVQYIKEKLEEKESFCFALEGKENITGDIILTDDEINRVLDKFIQNQYISSIKHYIRSLEELYYEYEIPERAYYFLQFLYENYSDIL